MAAAAVLCALLFAPGSASAADLEVRNPNQPPPAEVRTEVRKKGGFFSRLFNRGSQRSDADDDDDDRDRDDDDDDDRTVRRAKQGVQPQPIFPSQPAVQIPPTIQPQLTFQPQPTAQPRPSRQEVGVSSDARVPIQRTPTTTIDTREARRTATADKPVSQAPAITSSPPESSRPKKSSSASQPAKQTAESNPKPSHVVEEEPLKEPAPEIAPASPPSLPANAAAPPPPEKPPIESGAEFARPVPGKANYVYPPGVAQSPENMVDVSGFTPGQVVRDPRTKALFRVP